MDEMSAGAPGRSLTPRFIHKHRLNMIVELLSWLYCIAGSVNCAKVLKCEILLSPFPPAVRLRDERLSLIKECITQCPTAYKQSTLLLELARLLRVSGNVHTSSFRGFEMPFPNTSGSCHERCGQNVSTVLSRFPPAGLSHSSGTHGAVSRSMP